MNAPHRRVSPNGVSAGRSCQWPAQRVLPAAFLLAALVVSGPAVTGCGKPGDSRPPETAAESTSTGSTAGAPATESPAATAPATTSAPASSGDFKVLEGKWLRGDGGYVLEIRRAGSDGKLEAAYFNPSPIRVAKAESKRQGGLVQVFVELRDQGYPGCTYTLVYDAGHDCLAGTYFQAAMGETFPVVFGRTR